MNHRLSEARAVLNSGRYEDALSLLQPLIASDVDEELLAMVGEALAGLGHITGAAEIFENAARLAGPRAAEFALRAARLHLDAGAHDAAQLIALRELQKRPEDHALLYLLVTLFQKTGETQLMHALKHRLATSSDPEHLLAAAALLASEPHDPANYEVYRKLRRALPDDPHIRFTHLALARDACDFETVAREEAAIRADIERDGGEVLAAEQPHQAVFWVAEEALLPKARNIGAIEPFTEESRRLRRQRPHAWSKRLRIGYVSADLWDDHATMRLLGEVLTLHDRDRFDVTLFCNTPDRFRGFDTGGRSRWGKILPIDQLDDAAAERLVQERGIDILVDLKGYTVNHRCGLFNRQAAPVQVSWLGFPGTVIAVDFDYIIGDACTLPEESAPHYHEVFCRLPECYQPNETIHRPRPAAKSRQELGLPEEPFLFASFNSPRKLTPLTLDLWARVLEAAPDAHLMVMAEETIRTAFAARGIDASRIHPVKKCAYVDHVARAQAADLALDTFPCNGHTTTSDMLWAGVPVVTMKGQGFPGRVSESLLHAIGLPDLIAEDAEDFIRLSATIASERRKADALKARIADNRFRRPLFDAERFCRHLEAAYEAMAERARSGLAPAPLDIAALPPRETPFRR